MSTVLQNLMPFSVKIAGTAIPIDLADSILEIVVDMTLDGPDMATLRIIDPDLKWVDSTLLDLGGVVEISAPSPVDGSAVVLTKVEIVSIEPNYSATGVVEVVVRGYGKMSRLHYGRKTRTFLSQKDSDIVSTIASECGLTAQVDATTTVYDWLAQWNQTNMEFLMERAERIGYQVFSDGTNLYFKSDSYTSGTTATAAYGIALSEFRPRLSLAAQLSEVKVHGWDVATKAAIVGTGSPTSASNQGGATSTGGGALTTAFAAASVAIHDPSVKDVTDANKVATGLAEQVNREHIETEGTTFGDPNVRPGNKITISGVGTRFNGSYAITAATHTFSGGGYMTRFETSGRNRNTVARALGEGRGRAKVSGVIVGMVTNLDDPDNYGRVKVKFPSMPSGDTLESHWVRIATPMAGAARGLMILPEINDEVLVAFEDGEITRPYIVGMLWNGTDAPPRTNSVAAVSGKVEQRVFKTRLGHEVIFQDKDGETLIHIKEKGGNEILLDGKSGSEKVTITAKKDMQITVGGNLAIDVTGTTTLNSTGKMELKTSAAGLLKATGAMDVKSDANASVNAGGNLALAGTGNAELKANGMLTLQAGGIAELKGSLVKIN
jgi:uncharacterized protein involved in type VI secretion and phage assembly